MPSHFLERPKIGIIVDVKKKSVLTGQLNRACLRAGSLPLSSGTELATSAGGVDLKKSLRADKHPPSSSPISTNS